MRKSLFLAAALLIAPLCHAQEPAAPAEHLDTTPPGLPHIHAVDHKNITYRTIDGHVLQLDVYAQPSATPAPVIVYWHGGAWWKGQRPASSASFRALINMGFSIVSVDYRLTDVKPAPAAIEDVRCSLAWTAAHAAEFHFDTSRIVAYGTSAGGHLALLAAFLPDHNDIDAATCGPVPHIAAVMDFYGIPDVTGVITTGIPLAKSTRRWVGDGDAGLAMATRMSPNTYLRAGLPPIFIAHGDADPVVPYTQSTTLKARLEALHIPVTMITVPGGVHGKFPPEQMAKIYAALLDFFRTNHILPQ
jgi:acetyl esterase/lipase